MSIFSVANQTQKGQHTGAIWPRQVSSASLRQPTLGPGAVFSLCIHGSNAEKVRDSPQEFSEPPVNERDRRFFFPQNNGGR